MQKLKTQRLPGLRIALQLTFVALFCAACASVAQAPAAHEYEALKDGMTPPPTAPWIAERLLTGPLAQPRLTSDKAGVGATWGLEGGR